MIFVHLPDRIEPIVLKRTSDHDKKGVQEKPVFRTGERVSRYAARALLVSACRFITDAC